MTSAVYAATCACYFGEQSSCSEVYVADRSTDADCKKQCEKSFPKALRSYTFDNGEGYVGGGQVGFDCEAARNAALAAHARANPAPAPSPTSTDLVFAKPVLNIDIPTVSFSAPKQVGEFVESSIIGEYIAGLYKYLITIAVVISMVMIMIGGLQYALGGINQEQKSKGKDRIKNGVTGLILLLTTYLILFTINPQLLRNTVIQLPDVESVDLPAENDPGDIDFAGDALCKTHKECEIWCSENPDPTLWPTKNDKTIDPRETQPVATSPGIIGNSQVRITAEMATALKRAGSIAVNKNDDLSIFVSSGFRSLKRQIENVCPRYKETDPVKRAEKIKAIGSDVAFPGASNHGSGNAIDVVLREDGEDITTCCSTKTQNNTQWKAGAQLLAEIMAEAGMVRYNKEIWHFELEGKTGGGCRCKGSACPFPANTC